MNNVKLIPTYRSIKINYCVRRPCRSHTNSEYYTDYLKTIIILFGKPLNGFWIFPVHWIFGPEIYTRWFFIFGYFSTGFFVFEYVVLVSCVICILLFIYVCVSARFCVLLFEFLWSHRGSVLWKTLLKKYYRCKLHTCILIENTYTGKIPFQTLQKKFPLPIMF